MVIEAEIPYRPSKLFSDWGWVLGYFGAVVGFIVQNAANHAYAWLTSFLFGWLPQMQWQWSDWRFSPWYPVAGLVLGAVAAQCFVLQKQGLWKDAANRAFWAGLGATILSLSFVCFFLYAQFYFAYDWCGNSRIGAPTGIHSFKAQRVGTIVFTNVPFQASLLMLFWGWRQKRALRFSKTPTITSVST